MSRMMSQTLMTSLIDDEEDANMQNALEEHAELLRPKQRAHVGGYPDKGDGCSSVIIRAASDALGSTLTDMCGVVISEHFRAKSCNLKNLSPIKNLY